MKKKPGKEKSPVAFWEEFLKVMNQNSDLFKDVKPSVNVGRLTNILANCNKFL